MCSEWTAFLLPISMLCEMCNRFVLTMDLICWASACASNSQKTNFDRSYHWSKPAEKGSSGLCRNYEAQLYYLLVYPWQGSSCRVSHISVSCFIAVVIQCSCLSTCHWLYGMLFLHDSYLFSFDSAVVDYQVLGQQNGTGCMVIF